jgi:hypothetical protein
MISLAPPFAPTVAAPSFCHDWIESEVIPSSGSVRESWFLARLGSSSPAWLGSSTPTQFKYSGSTRCDSAPKRRLCYFTQSPLTPPKRPAPMRVRMAQPVPHPALPLCDDHLRPQLAGGRGAHTVSAARSTSRPPGPVTRSTASSPAGSIGNASRAPMPRMTPSTPNLATLLHVDCRRRPSRRWHHSERPRRHPVRPCW